MLRAMNFKMFEVKEVVTQASRSYLTNNKKIIYTIETSPKNKLGARVSIFTDFTKNEDGTYTLAHYPTGELYLPYGLEEMMKNVK